MPLFWQAMTTSGSRSRSSDGTQITVTPEDRKMLAMIMIVLSKCVPGENRSPTLRRYPKPAAKAPTTHGGGCDPDPEQWAYLSRVTQLVSQTRATYSAAAYFGTLAGQRPCQHRQRSNGVISRRSLVVSSNMRLDTRDLSRS
ncbi:hypothetical protein CB0940_04378 [Cercospora beticola]|uniref:Uncharacterized protein n=1 Tax=Cercospora beticola TaxID=122368 RepID=A0A2G5HMB4_CERBT|nr:hypothetical protein CB0940_04378 [Cercospora beticola]PIA93680.1 hypothetical protein CB0940_04378 [Cercospora beticola]WPB01615.1 hypothetical protein RHO25_006244 [Cercospora beticola]